MLPQIHIPIQPSCHDCLAWSRDGELAVAAGEEVYLFIPCGNSPEPWTQVRIAVNKFTFEEWPQQEQSSFEDMSIGEEQAKATVAALEWSPPGLAKHRRPVLAILTSNLILSLWAANGNPADLNSWERVLVVNTVLPSGTRLQQRIRSMAWAPTKRQHADHRTPFSRRKWGIFIMAIADDSNGLYFLEITSPFAGQSLAWNIEVLHHHDIPVPSSSNNRPSLFSHAINTNRFVDHIEFGNWNGSVPVVYRTSGINHFASVSVYESPLPQVEHEDDSEHESLTLGLEETHSEDLNLPSRIEVTPPMKARMLAEKKKFGLDNNIGSQVMLRMWGLASFENIVAACVTLHPAKMIEYVNPFDGTTKVLFGSGDKNGDTEVIFPWQDGAPVDVAKAQGAILDTIVDSLQRPLVLNDFDFKIIYTAVCGILLLNDGERLERLGAAYNIMSVLERHGSMSLQSEDRALQSIKTSSQISGPELLHIFTQMTQARDQRESSLHTPEKALLEQCPFCPADQGMMPCSDLTEAHCSQGHSFSKPFHLYLIQLRLTSHAARCALTFLPLLEPGITKRCFKCERECIDEESHLGVQMRLSQRSSSTDDIESNVEYFDAAQEQTERLKSSLASILFDKFDTCPYCGGKFCG